jgi:hypothetical protein
MPFKKRNNSKSILTGVASFSQRQLLNPILTTRDIATILIKATTASTLYYPLLSLLTNDDLATLQTIHTKYALPLSVKNYEAINTDYQTYVTILNKLRSIDLTTADESLVLLINIVEDTLQGAINLATLYMHNIYDEMKLANLKQEEQDILSKKNQHSAITDAEGQYSAKKEFFLSPLYSNYIYLYGMPKFGVGFDPDKVIFVEKLLSMLAQTNEDLAMILNPQNPSMFINDPTVDASDNLQGALDSVSPIDPSNIMALADNAIGDPTAFSDLGLLSEETPDSDGPPSWSNAVAAQVGNIYKVDDVLPAPTYTSAVNPIDTVIMNNAPYVGDISLNLALIRDISNIIIPSATTKDITGKLTLKQMQKKQKYVKWSDIAADAMKDVSKTRGHNLNPTKLQPSTKIFHEDFKDKK